MQYRSSRFFVLFVLLSFLLSGCYYFSAKNEIKEAEHMVSQLKAQGGEKAAPYEYTSAEKFLEVARIEFSDNDFKVAKGFATRSKSAAEAGFAEISKKK